MAYIEVEYWQDGRELIGQVTGSPSISIKARSVEELEAAILDSYKRITGQEPPEVYMHLRLCKEVDESIQRLASAEATGFAADMDMTFADSRIFSPPEQLFYLHWQYNTERRDYYPLSPQHSIGPYYADFVVNFTEGIMNRDWHLPTIEMIADRAPRLAIEIDGHWHEKTPEQVEKDKQRERFIISQGYTVLRYSALEVFKDAVRCAEEAHTWCFNKMKPLEEIAIQMERVINREVNSRSWKKWLALAEEQDE